MGRTLPLEEVKGRTAYDLLTEVVQRHEPITVVLEEGATVTLQETPKLEPLPQFSIFIPEGWKDAIYEDDHRH